MKTINKLNQVGDTIIEVMVVLVVLSMSFGISYATANKGLGQSLNSQEHSEAVGIMNTQLEELRVALTTHPSGFPPSPGQYFCMTGDNTYANLDLTSTGGIFPSSSDADSRANYSEYGFSCTVSTYFHVSISQANPASSTTYYYTTPVPTYCNGSTQLSCNESSFTIMVRWDGTSGLGPQQESITYRFGDGTGSIIAKGNYQSPETYIPPVPILVILHAIPLTGPPGTTTDPTPSCSAPATGGVAGATVNLTGPSYNISSLTNINGTTQFNGLTDNNTYTATATGLPAGYQLCGASLPATLGSATPTSSTTGPITIDSNSVGIAARPVCTPQNITVLTGWNPVYGQVITGYTPVYTNEIVSYTPNYSYAWTFYEYLYSSSSTTYIGKYAKYSNTTPQQSTLGWIAWQDPYYSRPLGLWVWPMYQVYDYISSYTPVYGLVLTGYTPIYTTEIVGYTPVYATETIYNCP